MREIERTWLVAGPISLIGCRNVRIRQRYLRSGRRLRRYKYDDGAVRYEISEKKEVVPGDPTEREEHNVKLRRGEYRGLKGETVRKLVKTRHYVPLAAVGGLKAEVDVFRGKLSGLVLVEVEFPDRAAMEAFVPPPWFGRDVTLERWSSNSWLARHSFADLAGLL